MSSTPSTPTPEAKELELVGKVEMRIALTDSDAKLEAMLKVYLAPLLLKLGSEHLKVRNKVSMSSEELRISLWSVTDCH
jgi:proteasome component ECM29